MKELHRSRVALKTALEKSFDAPCFIRRVCMLAARVARLFRTPTAALFMSSYGPVKKQRSGAGEVAKRALRNAYDEATVRLTLTVPSNI